MGVPAIVVDSGGFGFVAPNPSAECTLMDQGPLVAAPWLRPRLTGDWGGLRDELGAKGVVFDVDLLVTPLDVLSGGRNTGGDTWGNADYTLNVDTEKLGLWPGGFLNVSVDTSFGTALNNSGSISPVNQAFLIPESNALAQCNR